MSQLSLIFCFFPLLSSSSFFFFLFSRRGWNSRTHKERKRRKWRKRAKLLLSPFLPTIASKYQSVLPSDQLEDTGFLCSAPPKMPTPTSCKEWTNVSGQIRTQKKTNASSQLALPTLFLVSLFSDSKFCVDSKDRSYLFFFIHGGVPFSSIFLRFWRPLSEAQISCATAPSDHIWSLQSLGDGFLMGIVEAVSFEDHQKSCKKAAFQPSSRHLALVTLCRNLSRISLD